MSQGYPRHKLSDLAARIDYGLTASAIQDAVGPRFLRITDIVPQQMDWSAVPFCGPLSERDRAKFALEVDDIVIARTGATVGYSKRVQVPVDAVFASYLVRVRVNPDCDAAYIAYVVGSDDYKAFIKANAGGAAQPNANARVLTSYEVPLPPLPVQRKIGEMLSAFDDLIENNNRRIKILEEMAQRIYREWFVHYRYSGHEAVPLVDAEVGPIPEGWSVVKLGDAIEFVYGKALKAQARRDGPVSVYGSSGIIGQHDEALSEGPGIVVGRKGNVGAVHWSDDAFFAIDTTYWVRSSLPLAYCYYALREMQFLDSHAAVPGLSREQAYSLPLLVPDSGAVGAFAQIVGHAFAVRHHWKMINRNLTQTRDLLLPRLVSGDIDVSRLIPDLDA